MSASPLESTPYARFRHYLEIDPEQWPWPHFSAREIACRHCGEVVVHAPTLDLFEAIRELNGARPIRLNSAHRCSIHNAQIGGASLSSHLVLAGDLSTVRRNRARLLDAALGGGARGIGLYRSFIHVDLGRQRTWYGGVLARDIWRPILEQRRSRYPGRF